MIESQNTFDYEVKKLVSEHLLLDKNNESFLVGLVNLVKENECDLTLVSLTENGLTVEIAGTFKGKYDYAFMKDYKAPPKTSLFG